MSDDRFFVVCIEAVEEQDLPVGRLYRAQPDQQGARSGFIRAWDESREDYLHPASAFIQVTVASDEVGHLEAALAAG